MEALAAAVNAEVESEFDAPEPAAELNPSEDEGYKSERSRAKRWDKVQTSYIDHRTKDPNRKEVRKQREADAIESGEMSGSELIQTTGHGASKRNSDGTWTVATSYIDHRTRDPNNLEVRRAYEGSDTEQMQDISARLSSGATRSSDGSWQVNTSYVNQRTRLVENLEKVQSRKRNEVAVPSKSAFKQRSGNWAVDTAYIGHHTKDPGTLRKNISDMARSAEEADRPPGPFDRLSRMQGLLLEAEVENTYRIYAKDGMEDLFCATADSNCVGRHFRMCFGNCAPWTVNIYHTQDLENYEVAYQAHLPATLSCCCIGRPEARLIDQAGDVLGRLKSTCGSGFTIKSRSGEDAYNLNGACCNLWASLCPLPMFGMNTLQYTILETTNRAQVGSITKRVPSMLRLFTASDDDDIRVEFPKIRHPRDKALIMATAVLIGSRNFGGSSSGPKERDNRWVGNYEHHRTE